MRSLNLFYYGSGDFIREIGKKGTQSDITLYGRKTDDYIFTILHPSMFPEKLSSLTDSIAPVDAAVLQVDSIDRSLGEVIMALDLFGINNGIIYSNEENSAKLRQIISGTNLKNYSFAEGGGGDVIAKTEKFQHRTQGKGVTVLVDHFFTVRSVGTVALGFVLSGKVEKHQELHANYGNKEVQVKSIQVQDEDVPEADAGTRVGLALKNIDSEELERGMILSSEELKTEKSLTGTISPHPAVRNRMPESGEIFLASTMRYQRGTMSGNRLDLDSPIYMLGNEGVICSNTATPRILGAFRMP